MCRNPLVSVCCLTYRHQLYIRECIEGFLMQETNFEYEIIIHDDASDDGTRDILEEYASKYPGLFKLILQDENQYSQGIDVMSILFSYATGKYIAMCEGDDYWTDPLKLQKQVDFLEANTEFSMCFHRATIGNEICNKTWLKCENLEEREYSANELFRQWIVPTASIVYKTEVNHLPIIRNEDVLNGDIILVLKCCSYGKVMALKDLMSVYRMHNGGVTYSERFVKERLLKYPKHYLCIKRNFGDILDRNHLNKTISESYWNIRELGSDWFHCQLYKLIAFLYAPRLIIAKYRHRD